MTSGIGASKRVNSSPYKVKSRHSGENRSPDDRLFLWSGKTQTPLRQWSLSAHKVGFVLHHSPAKPHSCLALRGKDYWLKVTTFTGKGKQVLVAAVQVPVDLFKIRPPEAVLP